MELSSVRPALSTAISATIGAQHFADGQIVGSGVFATAVAGEPAPFNATRGSDITGPNFSAAWTFDYSFPANGNITSASLLIGVALQGPGLGVLGGTPLMVLASIFPLFSQSVGS